MTPENTQPLIGKARTPAQQQMTEDTRFCSAQWRMRKAELTPKGETWQSFLKTCRTARKSSRGA